MDIQVYEKEGMINLLMGKDYITSYGTFSGELGNILTSIVELDLNFIKANYDLIIKADINYLTGLYGLDEEGGYVDYLQKCIDNLNCQCPYLYFYNQLYASYIIKTIVEVDITDEKYYKEFLSEFDVESPYYKNEIHTLLMKSEEYLDDLY